MIFNFGKRTMIFLITFLAFIILISPLALRVYESKPVFFGGDIYSDLLISKSISQSGFGDFSIDEISLFHYLTAAFFSLVRVEFLVFLSIFFGILSSWLFFILIKRFFLDSDIVFVSTMLFIFSPLFIGLFTTPSALSLSLFFFLLFIVLLFRNNYLSVIFISLLSMTNIIFFLIAIFILIIYVFYSRAKGVFWSNILISCVSLVVFIYFNPQYISSYEMFVNPSLSSFFVSFGSNLGLSFFYFFLGVVGMFTLWERKRNSILVFLSFLLVFVFSLFTLQGLIVLNLYLSALSGAVIIFLSKRVWELSIIKKFTLLLIICGILFTSTLYFDEIIHSEPSRPLINSLSNVDEGIVLSHEINSNYINYFSKGISYMPGADELLQENHYLKDIQENIFQSRNLARTNALLKENNISYIFISPEMKKGLVWEKESQGLLFLLENSPNFKLNSDINSFQLWEVLFY